MKKKKKVNKPLTLAQKVAWKNKQTHSDAISKALSKLPVDAKGNVSLGAAVDAVKSVNTLSEKGKTVAAAPFIGHTFTADMSAIESGAISWMKKHPSVHEFYMDEAKDLLKIPMDVVGKDKWVSKIEGMTENTNPADILSCARKEALKIQYCSGWSVHILDSTQRYLIHGSSKSHFTYNTKNFFSDHDALAKVIEGNFSQTILNQASYQIDADSQWTKCILDNAIAYLSKEDIISLQHLSFKFDGDKCAAEDAMNEAVKMLKDINTELGKTGLADPNANLIVSHALAYLQGEDISDYTKHSLDFFEIDSEFKPLPSIQLGMLGREDDRLTKKEAKLKKVIMVDGRIVDDPNVKVVKCCDGEGEHEYEDGDDPHCACIVAECGCIVDEEDTHACSNCGQCEDKCCECVTCNSCGNRFSNDNTCDACECCSDCCSCTYCEGCESHHGEDTEMCGSCNRCINTCCCTNCKECGTEESKLDYDISYCPECHCCSSCGCACTSHKVTYSHKVPDYVPQTQKAKGFAALRTYCHVYSVPAFSLQKAEGSNPELLAKKFVRPCPMTPRHGFVDSRLVLDAEDGQKLIDETLKADPNAELIVMNKINAQWSGIWTPGKLIIGPGNDGATAGHGSIAINIAGDMFIDKPEMLNQAGIKDSVYAEMLWVPQSSAKVPPNHYFVQLRDGPKLPETIDHIPNEMIIKNIIVADGDLLEWETKMKNQPEGTVVHHPGGSLASHYAVHAVLNHIPVLISRVPVVGETLAPTQDGEVKPDIEAIRRGFHYGMTVECDYNSATFMMLLGVHSTAQWLGKHDTLLGAALGLAYRLTITAAVGEWRHRPNRRKSKLSRDAVYSRVFDRVARIRGLYMRTLKDFRQLVWFDGMGGDQWFQFTQWGAVILNCVIEGNVTAALGAMNNAVHSSHNNGWGFNKFAEGGAMDRVAKAPIYAAKYCAPLMYRILTRNEDQVREADAWYTTGEMTVEKVFRKKLETRTVTPKRPAKRLPIEMAKVWITQVPVTPTNAESAQVRVVGPEAIEIQFRLAKNSRCYSKEVRRIDPERVEKIKKIINQVKEDGRLMTTFEPNEDGQHPNESELKNDDPRRQFIKITRENTYTWALFDCDTMSTVSLQSLPLGPQPPDYATQTEQGTVIPIPPDIAGGNHVI